MTGTGKDIRESRSNRPPLPRQVQEHLGQKLRAQLYEDAPKPQYLGDPAIPREFDSLIERIESMEKELADLRHEPPPLDRAGECKVCSAGDLCCESETMHEAAH